MKKGFKSCKHFLGLKGIQLGINAKRLCISKVSVFTVVATLHICRIDLPFG